MDGRDTSGYERATRGERNDRYAGVLHCPACCRALGWSESPDIVYLDRCPCCRRKLTIQLGTGVITVALERA